MPYYGLYIPVKGGGATASGGVASASGPAASSGNGVSSTGSNDTETESAPYVFRKKIEALEVLKMHKDGRLKEFSDEEDAIKYAQTGFEVVQNKFNDVKTNTSSLEKAAFRAPTKQELVKFRKLIENDEYDLVKQYIWDNPRYLVSSGDTPTTLKEGPRYNAMHVCAISKRPRIAQLILDTVSDPNFVVLLTGKKNDEKMSQELCANLLDYYLNIPEKGRSETPLHFASKLGFVEMVEVLISYPECKMTPNSDGLLPKQIICGRVSNPKYEIIKRIADLFEERYYVPVLRCEDSSVPAQIGQPFPANNPPTPNTDPMSPKVEIKALAGPMSRDQAKKFFRRWKTPPRLGSNVQSPIANNPFISPLKGRKSLPGTPRSGSRSLAALNLSLNSPTALMQRRTLFNSTPQRKASDDSGDVNAFDDSSILNNSYASDHHNGNQDKENIQDPCNKQETNNNHHDMGSKLKASLCPGTPLFKIKRDLFLTYRDQGISSPVLTSIEQNTEIELFNCSEIYDSPGFKERHLKNTDTEKGIECIGRNLAKEQNIEWKEYWDFLEEFIDIGSEAGMQKLEAYLAQKQREYEIQQTKRVPANSDMLEEVCSALEKFSFDANAAAGMLANYQGGEMQYNGIRGSLYTEANSKSAAQQNSTPYTYVEKSLQVHARRMTKSIVHNIDNVVSINDALLLELRRVKSLICSFKVDASFSDVHFEKVHSRIGNLVSMFLMNAQEISLETKAKILNILQNLLLTPGERRDHIECLCARILYMLENPAEQILPENLKTEEMCAKVWRLEKDCECQWESNMSRKTSRRNRMEARYKNHQRQRQQEKAEGNAQKSLNTNAYRETNVSNDSSDETEEDVFWSDFGGSDSEQDDDVWFTPPGSPSRAEVAVNEHSHKIFIFGNEPTKRDLDVLNAIFHVEVDKAKLPTIHSWKTALLRYSNDQMDFFPSPTIVKTGGNGSTCREQTSSSHQRSRHLLRSSSTTSVLALSPQRNQSGPAMPPAVIRAPILQLPMAKRLFASPGRPKSMTALPPIVNNAAAASAAKAADEVHTATEPISSPAAVATHISRFRSIANPLTPLNKLRGLFSSYRERLDSSPMPSTIDIIASNEGSNNNLSMLNISASE